jgi:hypothetical protein
LTTQSLYNEMKGKVNSTVLLWSFLFFLIILI